MNDAERRQRDLEVLLRSRRALDDQRLGRDDASGPASVVPPQPAGQHEREDDSSSATPDSHVMYRGKPVKRQSGSNSRGPSSERREVSTGKVDLGEALKRLAELHNQGLISRSEYDKKRLQILDRL